MMTDASADGRLGRARARRVDPARPAAARRGPSRRRTPARQDAPRPARRSPRPGPPPISSSATPSSASASGSRSSSRPMTAEPVRRRRRARAPARTTSRPAARRSRRAGRTAGWPGPRRTDGRDRTGQQVRLHERDPVRRRHAPTAFSARVERVVGHVGREDLDRRSSARSPAQRDGEGDRDGAAARPDVDDPDRRRTGRPRRSAEPPHDLRLGELDEPLGLRSRDQRPASTANASP